MTINGVEFDIDATDADFIERYELKYKEVEEQINELDNKKDTISAVKGIRQECKIIKDFLDYVLGEGASEKIFKGKDSLKLCINAFEDIINNVDKQHREMQETFEKYSPERLKR